MGSGSICVRIVCQIRGDRRLPKGAVLTCGRSAALYSMNLNTRALMSQECASCVPLLRAKDRKSTRLNSSHVAISYAVFCLKKKKINDEGNTRNQSYDNYRYCV